MEVCRYCILLIACAIFAQSVQDTVDLSADATNTPLGDKLRKAGLKVNAQVLSAIETIIEEEVSREVRRGNAIEPAVAMLDTSSRTCNTAFHAGFKAGASKGGEKLLDTCKDNHGTWIRDLVDSPKNKWIAFKLFQILLKIWHAIPSLICNRPQHKSVFEKHSSSCCRKALRLNYRRIRGEWYLGYYNNGQDLNRMKETLKPADQFLKSLKPSKGKAFCRLRKAELGGGEVFWSGVLKGVKKHGSSLVKGIKKHASSLVTSLLRKFISKKLKLSKGESLRLLNFAMVFLSGNSGKIKKAMQKLLVDRKLLGLLRNKIVLPLAERLVPRTYIDCSCEIFMYPTAGPDYETTVHLCDLGDKKNPPPRDNRECAKFKSRAADLSPQERMIPANKPFKDPDFLKSSVTIFFHKRKRNPKTQSPEGQEIACTLRVRADFHICVQTKIVEAEKNNSDFGSVFANSVVCKGNLVKRPIFTELTYDNGDRNAHCAAWFSVMDGSVRGLFSAIGSLQTARRLHRCHAKEKNMLGDDISVGRRGGFSTSSDYSFQAGGSSNRAGNSEDAILS